jgi:cytochrome c5
MKWIMLAVMLATAACSPVAPRRTTAEAVRHALSLKPADPRLADLYAQSCRACHTAADTGAPLAGDPASWEPRWKKGMPALLSSTVGGLNGMPAGGQCFSCTPQDYEALIQFMSGHKS